MTTTGGGRHDRKTNAMRKVEEAHGRPMEELLLDLLNRMTQTAAAKVLGVRPNVILEWRYRLNIDKVAKADRIDTEQQDADAATITGFLESTDRLHMDLHVAVRRALMDAALKASHVAPEFLGDPNTKSGPRR